MKSFKQYLAENDYPGGYYTQDMHRMVAHFNNAKEKEEFDADPRNDPNDELIYRSDKRMKAKQAATQVASTASEYAVPIAKTAIQAALGKGLLSEVPIEKIENTAEAIQEELRKVNAILEEIARLYNQEKDREKREKLKDRWNHYSERKQKLSDKWRKYQDQNYV